MERLHEVAADIEDRGGEAIVHPFDLQDESRIPELINTVEDEFGQLNILINNAGIGKWQFDDIDNSTIRTVNEVNLLGYNR